MLDDRGEGGTDVRLELVPERRYELPGSSASRARRAAAE